ncbi:MAG: hypothetical protein MJ224_03070 [archaeon]|nr:hypothetical protein [archaeon]
MTELFESFDDSSVRKLDEEYLSLSEEDRKKWVRDAKKKRVELYNKLMKDIEKLEKEGFFEKNKI